MYEDQDLLKMYSSNQSMEHIATLMGRSLLSIKCRIRLHALNKLMNDEDLKTVAKWAKIDPTVLQKAYNEKLESFSPCKPNTKSRNNDGDDDKTLSKIAKLSQQVDELTQRVKALEMQPRFRRTTSITDTQLLIPSTVENAEESRDHDHNLCDQHVDEDVPCTETSSEWSVDSDFDAWHALCNDEIFVSEHIIKRTPCAPLFWNSLHKKLQENYTKKLCTS